MLINVLMYDLHQPRHMHWITMCYQDYITIQHITNRIQWTTPTKRLSLNKITWLCHVTILFRVWFIFCFCFFDDCFFDDFFFVDFFFVIVFLADRSSMILQTFDHDSQLFKDRMCCQFT